MADKEFLSFEEALKELRLKEEELKRLVSEGEIRAFREGETMRLRRTDVDTLRQELTGGEVVELGGVNEEIVFEDDSDLDAGMKTEEITEADTLLEDDVEEVREVAVEAEEPEEEDEPIRARPVEVPEPSEDMFTRTCLVLTALVLVCAMPVVASVTTGNLTDLSHQIAGIFVELK